MCLLTIARSATVNLMSVCFLMSSRIFVDTLPWRTIELQKLIDTYLLLSSVWMFGRSRMLKPDLKWTSRTSVKVSSEHVLVSSRYSIGILPL